MAGGQQHSFNGRISRTSRHQNGFGKLCWVLMKQDITPVALASLEICGNSCILLQSDNHARSPSLKYCTDWMSAITSDTLQLLHFTYNAATVHIRSCTGTTTSLTCCPLCPFQRGMTEVRTLPHASSQYP